jgi:hypothetical protein
MRQRVHRADQALESWMRLERITDKIAQASSPSVTVAKIKYEPLFFFEGVTSIRCSCL